MCPIFPDTPDGRAARLAYYEARKLNNPPNSLYDYNAAKRGDERPAERRAANDATTALLNRPTAIKHVAFPPKRDAVLGELAFSLVTRPYKTTIGAIPTRRIVYWLAAMVVLLVVGTIIGLIWADTSDVAGAFAEVTNIVSGVGIVVLLIALAVKRRRRPS